MGVEGRAVVTGTDEKGLESTGRATKEYFEDKYKDDKTTINLASEGSIDTSNLGTNVGDKIILKEIPDKNGKRVSDVNREVGLGTFIENVAKSSGENFKYYKNALKELEVLFRNGEILEYKELSESEKQKFFEIFSKDNADKLKIVKNNDGSETIEIIEKSILNNIKDELIRAKTMAVRAIIESETPIVYQNSPKIDFGDKNLNKIWEKTFGAINIFTPEEVVTSPKDLSDLVYYGFNHPLGEYIYSIDIDKNGVLRTNYKNRETIENHELIGHPYDFVQITSGTGTIKFLNKDNSKVRQIGDAIYFEDKYKEIKDKDGKTKIVAQPFWFDGEFYNETNTLILEELTNKKYNGNSETNTRFLYDTSLLDKIKIFDNFKDFTNFFNEK